MSPNHIHLTIKNLGGSVEHYYHFLLGFLVPLVIEMENYQENKIFLSSVFIRSCGPMDQHLLSLGYQNLKLINKNLHENAISNNGVLTNDLLNYQVVLGQDGGSGYDRNVLRRASKIIKKRLDTSNSHKNEKLKNSIYEPRVILIKRSLDSYYNSVNSEIKRSGTQRRSIANIDELEASLRLKFPNFNLLILEGTSLAYQVEEFRAADIVIAQHGAALANLIFARPGTKVIEIFPKGGYESEECFRSLAKCLKLFHYSFEQDSKHAAIDVEGLLRLINVKLLSPIDYENQFRKTAEWCLQKLVAIQDAFIK